MDRPSIGGNGMKDDFVQKFDPNGLNREDGNNSNSEHGIANDLPVFEKLEKSMGRDEKNHSVSEQRKEKIKNFALHLDEQELNGQSEKILSDMPETEERDIYSDSGMHPELKRSEAQEKPKDFMVSDSLSTRYRPIEREAGVDISASHDKTEYFPLQTAPKPSNYQNEEILPNNKWPKKKNAHKKGGGCLKGFFLATIVAVCAVTLSWYLISCVNDLLGLVKTETAVTVTVPQNATTDDIAEILKKNGLIDQELFFKIFTNFKYRNEKKYSGYIAGEYELNGKMGYEGMVNTMKYPVLENQTVTLTFAEGKSLMDIAKMLQESGVCSVEDFVKAVNEGEYDYKLIGAIPQDERFYKLEGYIFPDTYEFYIGEKPQSVVNRFLKNAQNRIGNDLMKRAEELEMTMDEVIVLASIIQKEASDPNEMGKVSSVFHNRLNKSKTYPNLQSDPTIMYVENDIIPYLSDASQRDKYAELYNTYKCVGLPVGPICSPGLEAIRAALYPEKTNYYYFVTDKNDKYYYARTNAEHEANIATADRVNKKIEEEAANAVAEG